MERPLARPRYGREDTVTCLNVTIDGVWIGE
jgi:hypothetical protein